MNPLTRFIFLGQILLALLAGLSAAHADVIAGLPVQGETVSPAILLELGGEPPSAGADDKTTRVFVGEVSSHEGDASVQTDKDEISALHPGFGSWKISFLFKITPGFPAKPYTFWARWRQGGDPDVCVQSFEIWAGPDPSRLELRATLPMKPKGWDYAWIAAESPVILKSDDAIIEVRDSGSGHDAKVFDAFLLGSPPLPPALPVSGSTDKPLVLLELGNMPVYASAVKDAALQVQTGTAVAGPGTESLLTEKDEVQVFHQGFGTWAANFLFELNPEITPGQYRFFARYKSGGEVSQVTQNFTVKAGAKPDELAARADFALTNASPWEYQWLQAAASVIVLPGDRWLQIDNTGKADGAKVFDAFLLQLETPLGDWMNAEQAQTRNRFLALTKVAPTAKQRLYVLDGKGEQGEMLFRGLAADAARPHYKSLSVSYLVGPEAEALAQRLNLPALPAAVMTDDHYGVLGALSKPRNEVDVSRFLADPAGTGLMLAPIAASEDTPKPLQEGLPDAWLVGGLQDGLAGVSIAGLDSETVLRPNPDQPYLSQQMMGGEMRTWRKSPTNPDGAAVIEASTQHSYGWSRGSGYAQLYLHMDQSTQALLHLKQSGVKTAGWLDGKPFKFAGDPKPPSRFSPVSESVKSLLKGLTTEGLAVTALPERPEAPQVATLNLSQGWHSLLIKMVMQHDQGQRFSFAGQFTDPDGHPLDSIKTQLSDPSADLALNAIAAKLRPLIYVDSPANLPHPGDPLKLRVDMRWHPILEETGLSAPLPRFQAKLRLRLVDYGGTEITAREITGLFPGEDEADFGKTPESGYYAVYASLHTPDGKLIMNYNADGFSVVRGTAEQKHRLDKKKLWNNDYYALADGDKSFMQEGGYFSWLERMGIYKSYGGYPGFEPQYLAKWEQAKQHGLVLFADSSGDSAWLNDNSDDGHKFINVAAAFTRFFKSANEIDIRLEPEWQKLRDPAHWVERAKWEYEQSHKQRSDAHYVGGSLVRPGEGDWFKQVLQLGLDRYHDAWDVHAYPQQSPRFGGPIGNGSNEDERGVLAAYASLGKNNSLPFWLGETGAKAMHGFTGRRWQAEQAAKMIAWVSSRSDYLGLAFCIAHEYDLGYGRLWDYSMGHKPGEAALYTSGALIDGLPYKAFDANDASIQSAYFGDTFMIWRTDEVEGNWRMQLDSGKSWVLVDVVGRVLELPVDSTGNADIPIGSSPVYVLSRVEYERLMRK
ncbi:MAG: hypothetical protein ACXWT3_06250 [Methylococcaceae bacterium]